MPRPGVGPAPAVPRAPAGRGSEPPAGAVGRGHCGGSPQDEARPEATDHPTGPAAPSGPAGVRGAATGPHPEHRHAPGQGRGNPGGVLHVSLGGTERGPAVTFVIQ
ncbi:hypothetical protein GCM10010215_60820 [Streptomyces virginiae]|uniref:Uncharacterized protein n=1 Tax=Streptomyces virginiae TaxID=1961 RepID=A0ABQ3NV87_STRVG|nr:hypothetical protein GCM10010215_60820 [Streptomyces virginiae]GHI16702.1 hypothetical protein Scinn_61650 [Streptomyces virginiae]GLV95459.1 hypothetical protein Slala04_69120 [Streptomyces lavendulae subsp. lavendulae]